MDTNSHLDSPRIIGPDSSSQRDQAALSIQQFHTAESSSAQLAAATSIGRDAARYPEYRAATADLLTDVRQVLLTNGVPERGIHTINGITADALRWEQIHTRVYDPSDLARGQLTEIGTLNTYNVEVIAGGRTAQHYESLTTRQLEQLVGHDNASAIAERVGVHIRYQSVVDDTPANVSRTMSGGVLSGSDLHGAVVPSDRTISDAIGRNDGSSNSLPPIYAEAVTDLRREMGANAKLFLAQDDHTYVGPIVYTNDMVAAQQAGDGKVVLHGLERLSNGGGNSIETISAIVESLAAGNPLSILYREKEPPQVDKVIDNSHQHSHVRDRGIER